MKRSEYEERLNKYEEEIEELKKCIEELKNEKIEEDVAWKPAFGEQYWIIDTNGRVCNDFWDGYSSEINSLNIGNVFRTKEEAEFQIEKLKVISELKRFSRNFDKNKDNFCIKCDMTNQYIIIYNNYHYVTGELCFASVKDAKDAIEFVGKDRFLKYYLGVKE